MNEQKNKYFEVKEPYYALIAAENEEKAKETYIDMVCDDFEIKDINEVDEHYALGRFIQAYDEYDKLKSINDAIKDFKETELLLVDASLI